MGAPSKPYGRPSRGLCCTFRKTTENKPTGELPEQSWRETRARLARRQSARQFSAALVSPRRTNTQAPHPPSSIQSVQTVHGVSLHGPLLRGVRGVGTGPCRARRAGDPVGTRVSLRHCRRNTILLPSETAQRMGSAKALSRGLDPDGLVLPGG